MEYWDNQKPTLAGFFSRCSQSLCRVSELSYFTATYGAVLFWVPHCMSKDSATGPLQLCAIPR